MEPKSAVALRLGQVFRRNRFRVFIWIPDCQEPINRCV